MKHKHCISPLLPHFPLSFLSSLCLLSSVRCPQATAMPPRAAPRHHRATLPPLSLKKPQNPRPKPLKNPTPPHHEAHRATTAASQSFKVPLSPPPFVRPPPPDPTSKPLSLSLSSLSRPISLSVSVLSLILPVLGRRRHHCEPTPLR